MKYKIEKEVIKMFPENTMDVFYLGKIWGQHGGSVMFVQDTDNPRKIEHYQLDLNRLFEVLTKHVP